MALPEVKLYYYKARVYDPVMGRFLQTDPIGSEDDLNLYAYVAGDPVNHVDPTGEGKLMKVAPQNYLLVQNFKLENSSTSPNPITAQDIEALGANLSGISSSGDRLTVKFVEVGDGSDLVTIKVDPRLNDSDPTGKNRSHADKIGGNSTFISPSSGPDVVEHELGHNIGAGDQYTGGVDATGNVITSGPAANSGGGIMNQVGTKANAQTIDEILNSPTNVKIDCSRDPKACT